MQEIKLFSGEMSKQKGMKEQKRERIGAENEETGIRYEKNKIGEG